MKPNSVPPQAPPPSRRRAKHLRIKRLAVCAMLAAVGTVVLYFGAMLEVFELCVAALAAMLIVPVVIEYGGGYPWALYAATALISLLLLPQKMPGAVYLVFGYYPILKAYLERLSRPICLVLKQILFVIIETTVIVASNFIMGVEQMPFWYDALLCVLGFVTLNLFDIALTRLITLYLRKYRARVSRLMN